MTPQSSLHILSRKTAHKEKTNINYDQHRSEAVSKHSGELNIKPCLYCSCVFVVSVVDETHTTTQRGSSLALSVVIVVSSFN